MCTSHGFARHSQTAVRAQRAANQTLVNPAGEEQSKQAAQQLSDANAEIPKALARGAEQAHYAPRFISFAWHLKIMLGTACI